MLEPTPEDELVDDFAETERRKAVFDIDYIPAPDFSLDVDPIQTGKRPHKSLFRLLALYDLPVLAGPQVWYGLLAFLLGCICVFCCCLFFPDFPVLADHTLSHPGILIF